MKFPSIGQFYKAIIISSLAFSCSKISAAHDIAAEKKIIICGVCQNVADSSLCTIRNIQKLGKNFKDYAVIIYENNSKDKTKKIFNHWAEKNHKVVFIHETVPINSLPASRTERIARARNIVIDLAKSQQYCDFEYLIMADLDFKTSWPIDEILATINNPRDWDCVTSNGMTSNSLYYDRYALRDNNFPFGAELLGTYWYGVEMCSAEIKFSGETWIPVYSAFGGLAIYKTASIRNFSYSGIVTEALRQLYRQLFLSSSISKGQLNKYLKIIGIDFEVPLDNIPVVFQENISGEHPANYNYITCCEHVTLHAAMYISGFDKIFINPKMIMQYEGK